MDNYDKIIDLMPKIELHAHLNGSLTDDVLFELALLKYKNKNSIEYKNFCENMMSIHDEVDDISECFKKFKIVHDLTSNKEGLQKATEFVIRDFSNDNVIYLELRTTPKRTDNMTQIDYLKTVLDTIKMSQEKYPNIIVKLLPSIDRSQGIKSAEEITKAILNLLPQYYKIIVGVDFSGNPEIGYFYEYKHLFRSFRSLLELKVALHCGEINKFPNMYENEYQSDNETESDDKNKSQNENERENIDENRIEAVNEIENENQNKDETINTHECLNLKQIGEYSGIFKKIFEDNNAYDNDEKFKEPINKICNEKNEKHKQECSKNPENDEEYYRIDESYYDKYDTKIYNEVYDMIKFKMDRCGHGTFINGSNFLLLKDYLIPVECCLTSNIKCKTIKSYEEHHFGKLYKMNHPVVICTDDAGIFKTNLSNEFKIAQKVFNLNISDLKTLSLNAVNASFADPDEKLILTQKIEKYFETLQNEN